MLVAGPAWVWVLPVALAGQCLLLAVYAELASEFPIAGGAYQWSRRLIGGAYGWFAGWVAICAYAAANTTIAYLGAPWALTLLDIEPTPHAIVLTGMVLVVVCALAGALGVGVLSRAVKAGIAAEVRRIGRDRARPAARLPRAGLLDPHRDAAAPKPCPAARSPPACSRRWPSAVGSSSDSTARSAWRRRRKDAARHVPRAIWIALLSVGALVILNAIAVELAHPDPAAVVAGEDAGSGDDRGGQLVRLVVVEAVRRHRAGRLPGMRHGGPVGDRAHDVLGRARRRGARVALPAHGRPAQGPDRRDRRRLRCSPASGCCSGSTSTAVGSLIAFGTAAIYVSFLLTALAALIARVRGSWQPGRPRAARRGRPRDERARRGLAGLRDRQHRLAARVARAARRALLPGMGGAAVVLAVIATVGVAYLLLAKPQRKLIDRR